MKHEFINPINETFDLIERYILSEVKKAPLPKNLAKRERKQLARRGKFGVPKGMPKMEKQSERDAWMDQQAKDLGY
jgi:hypothetical protein